MYSTVARGGGEWGWGGGCGEGEGEWWVLVASGEMERLAAGYDEIVLRRGEPLSVSVTPDIFLLRSPRFTEPLDAGEWVGLGVALRECLGEGEFRPPTSTCLKHIQSPFTLLRVCGVVKKEERRVREGGRRTHMYGTVPLSTCTVS